MRGLENILGRDKRNCHAKSESSMWVGRAQFFRHGFVLIAHGFQRFPDGRAVLRQMAKFFVMRGSRHAPAPPFGG
jgi:hypothetical protein